MSEWLKTCPNVKFGFTSTLLRSPPTQAAVHELDLSKILFESDAPYLPVPGYPRSHVTPWHMLPILDKLSKIKQIPVSLLANILNANAIELYGL